MSTLDKILEEIDRAESIVVITHKHPDGDAVGTSLALYNALKAYGKENVDVIIPKCPKTFDFLPSADKIKSESEIKNYDLAISVDCATTKMLDGWSNYFEDAKVSVVFDHHGTNEMYGDYNFVNPDAPACSEVMIVALNHFKVNITKEIGTCLLVGIITDTGGFKSKGVTAETFEFVAGLLKKGVNVSETYRRVLQVKTKSAFELTRIAMNNMQFFEDGKIVYTYVTPEDKERVKSVPGDHEGIVDIGRDIEGVEASIFIRPEGADQYKVSLRSNHKVNVDEIALLYGGGGHQKAAGFSTTETPEAIRDKIISEIKHYL